MVSAARPAARFLLTTLGIVVIGVLAAVATDVAVTVLTPVKLAFILGGVALLIPTPNSGRSVRSARLGDNRC